MRYNRSFYNVRISLFILLFLFTAGCSCFKDASFDLAMGMERCRGGLEASFIPIDDLEIGILEGEGRGERPALVFIHGFGASGDVWLRVSRHLKNDFHIVAIDLPGHGRSSKPEDISYDLGSQAHYLRSILAELALEKPHLVGNSMGGEIATLYAAFFPDEIASITLLNPGGVYAYKSELMYALSRGENPLIVESPCEHERLMAFTMEKQPFLMWPITSVLAEKAIENSRINKKIFNDAQLSENLLLDNRDFRDVLTSVRVPAMIVWGSEDRLLNAQNGRIFDELIPDSKLIILEGVGHAPMLETPKKTANLIRGFIERLPEVP